MSNGGLQPQSLPDWMLIFSFVASLFLMLLVIVEGICRALRKATLEIVLTREVFFRILDTGESLYSTAVLVAYDTGALIQDVKAALVKTNGATKAFDLRVAQVGEKYRTPEGSYQFGFHSTSPLTFVPPSNPQRCVYICEHESYSGYTRQQFQQFQEALFKIKERYSFVMEGTPDPAQLDNLIQDAEGAVEVAVTGIMDKIQIEPGKYTLTITATYRQKGKFFPMAIRGVSTSKVNFVVEDYARDVFRHSLREHLQARARQVLLDQPATASTPEYSPVEVQECAA